MTPDRFWRAAVSLAVLAALCLAPCFALAYAEAPGELNVLLVGVDSYAEDAAARSDVMMLFRLAPETGDVRALSFLRDLYVNVPGYGKTRLNAAYFYGGEALLKTTLAEAFQVRIDRTVTVSFSALAEAVDQLGGVEIEVAKKELEPLNDILKAYNRKIGLGATHGLVTEAGLQTLTGKQALSYSRIRKIDSDFQRVNRQHAVIRAMLDRLESMDFLSLAHFAVRNLNSLRTDLTLADMSALLTMLRGTKPALALASVPFEGTCRDETVNGMQVLAADLKRNQRKIEAFLTGE